MNERGGTILVVEDDVRFARLVREFLELEGYRVLLEHDGARAITRIRDELPDLVVLDHMLPGADGLTVLRAVRDDFPGPIVMLTARRGEVDQILGLELGADDYVAKPATPRLLLARIRAVLRRSAAQPVGEVFEDADLTVDFTRRRALLGGAEMDLTSAEFDLLQVLAENAGRPVSRDALLQKLRGIDYDGIDRSIDVRVSQLRRKLRASRVFPERIKTVRGHGYQLVPAPADAGR